MSSIDYFSIEGLPWLSACWLFLFLFRPLATFVHELGHLFPLYFLSDGLLLMRVGEDAIMSRKVGERVILEIGRRSLSTGHVSCDDENLGKGRQLLVLLGGPTLTFALMMALSFCLVVFAPSKISEVILVGFLCANLLSFYKSILPLRMKPSRSFPEGPPSDGLQIINLLKS